MKKTINCECGKEYNVEVPKCPDCGKVNPFKKKIILITVILVVVLVIGLIIGGIVVTKNIINKGQQMYELLNEESW